MPFIDVVIGLDDEIVVAVLVGQADVERAIGVGVRREQRNQLRAQGVHWQSVSHNAGHCIWNAYGRVAACGHRRRAAQLLRIADQRAEALVGPEDERLVLDDRAADATAELVLAHRLLRRRQSSIGIDHRVEVIARIKRVVALEEIRGAVDVVGPGLEPEVDDRARFPAIFGGGILLGVELLNRVDRQDRPGRALHAFGVDDRSAVVRIVVVDAVEDEIVVLGAIAVGADG